MHISGPVAHPVGSRAYFWSTLVLEMQWLINKEINCASWLRIIIPWKTWHRIKVCWTCLSIDISMTFQFKINQHCLKPLFLQSHHVGRGLSLGSIWTFPGNVRIESRSTGPEFKWTFPGNINWIYGNKQNNYELYVLPSKQACEIDETARTDHVLGLSSSSG